MIISYMYDLFYGLCKISARTKHLLLCWIGRLLDANKGTPHVRKVLDIFSRTMLLLPYECRFEVVFSWQSYGLKIHWEIMLYYESFCERMS